MDLPDFVSRILLAVLLGFLIGLERQLTGHMAGIRTNVLVSLGASIFVLVSIVMDAPDVTRIAAQIVTGVGFLCSGIIFKDGANVRGINTAATIWCTAAIGTLCSAGKPFYALAATGVLLAANVIIRFIATRIYPLKGFDEEEHTYKITVVCSEQKEFDVRSLIMTYIAGTRLSLIDLESADVTGGKVEIKAIMICGSKKQDETAEKLVGKISLEEGVTKAGWELT